MLCEDALRAIETRVNCAKKKFEQIRILFSDWDILEDCTGDEDVDTGK